MNFLQLLRSQPGVAQRLYVHMLAGARQFPETREGNWACFHVKHVRLDFTYKKETALSIFLET